MACPHVLRHTELALLVRLTEPNRRERKPLCSSLPIPLECSRSVALDPATQFVGGSQVELCARKPLLGRGSVPLRGLHRVFVEAGFAIVRGHAGQYLIG